MDILSMLAPKPTTIDLALSQWDGTQFVEVPQVTVTVCLPTWLERQEIEPSVDNPVAPLTKMDGNKKLPNYDDPDFVQAFNGAIAERQVRVVAFTLIKGGNDIMGVTWASLRPGGGPIDMAALERATDALREAAMGGFILAIDAYIKAALGVRAKNQAKPGLEAAARADSFPPAQAGGDADLLADGTDPRAGAEPD